MDQRRRRRRQAAPLAAHRSGSPHRGGRSVRRRPIRLRRDATPCPSQQALLVSNNPYGSPDELSGAGGRPRLDDGRLGVLGIPVGDAAEAAELAVRGSQSPGLTVMSAERVEVTVADADEIPVAVDGEALWMPTPVICTLRSGALRVLVPRDRPGVAEPPPPVNWQRIMDLALGRAEGTTRQ